jgi:hypothetical protein
MIHANTQTPYSFSILRYIHDPVTQEFVNIGVSIFSKEARYLDAKCETHYGRITRTFGKIDGDRFRQATRYIQEKLQRIGEQMRLSLPFERNLKIEDLLSRVLPPDDSAFQFAASGVGLTTDLDAALRELFARFVDKYSSPQEYPHPDDEEVWRVYREPLERCHVTSRLMPKKIVSPNFDYEFQRSWRNERWHFYEPISFDLVEASSIVDKANKWLGRGTNLSDSEEKFKMHILLGAPQDPSLKQAFIKAQNILNKMPGKPELVTEGEAEAFAKELAEEIKEHDLEMK